MSVKKFIKKLREHAVSKKYFVWTLWPKAELMVKVGLKSVDTHQMVDVDALLDSSATGVFMDRKFAERNEIAMWKLDKPIHVYNVDGTLNQGGSITHETTMMLLHKEHREKAVFEVCEIKCYHWLYLVKET